MKSLTDFLACLPGLMPRKARDAVLAPGTITEAARADLHERDAYWGPVVEVGPDAAQAILDAYREGRLPMRRRERPAVSTPEAEAYVARREALGREIAERRRRAGALKDVSLATEADLADHRFVDALFHAHAGAGATSLEIAGIAVTKSLSRYPSNSGRSHGWGVSFAWTGGDGVRRGSSSLPPEAGNRRNDAERDWGLPGG